MHDSFVPYMFSCCVMHISSYFSSYLCTNHLKWTLHLANYPKKLNKFRLLKTRGCQVCFCSGIMATYAICAWVNVLPPPTLCASVCVCTRVVITGRRDLNNGALQKRLDYLNNLTTVVVFITTVLNFFISTFGMQSTGYFPWLMMRIHWCTGMLVARRFQSYISVFIPAFKYNINVNDLNLNFPKPTDLTLFEVYIISLHTYNNIIVLI